MAVDVLFKMKVYSENLRPMKVKKTKLNRIVHKSTQSVMSSLTTVINVSDILRF